MPLLVSASVSYLRWYVTLRSWLFAVPGDADNVELPSLHQTITHG